MRTADPNGGGGGLVAVVLVLLLLLLLLMMMISLFILPYTFCSFSLSSAPIMVVVLGTA